MPMKIKKERVSKRTNRKQNFKKFVESGYTDYSAFLKACNKDENLLIYTCLRHEELEEIINKMKEYSTLDEQIKFLVNNQPPMNATLERFNKATESIAKYLKGYIDFNGWKMTNKYASADDWSSEFWAKYCKICEFYRVRWFFPDKLKKASTVSFSPILYKEFIYICRLSITGERKHLAFLATQDQGSSIFNVSLDDLIESSGNNEKTLGDLIPDAEKDNNYLLENANVNKILNKALTICKQYPEAVSSFDSIKDFYEKQDPTGFDKKTIILGKIFLYKAGLCSPKILAFIKSLSSTYKAKYNISQARLLSQMEECEPVKVKKKKDNKKEIKTWRELVLRKRGEL